MVYKRFRLICALRVVVLTATIFLFFVLLFRTTFTITTIIVGLVICYEVFALIRYVERTNHDLQRFLQSIRYADFSQTFTVEGLGKSFDELKTAFNEVLEAFRRTRAEKEEHFQYLQTVIQHIGIGLISYTADGTVGLINTAAIRLLQVSQLRNIHSLKEHSFKLVETLLRLQPGERALVKVERGGEMQQLAIYATGIKLHGESYTLASLQNIQSELEEKEMEAWQNLIRVLTHEIMNSITPISSLTATASDLLQSLDIPRKTTDTDSADEVEQINAEQAETIHDVQEALSTIQRRSQGLLHFVESYRNLTRIPKPKFQIFQLKPFFEEIIQLSRPHTGGRHVRLDYEIEPPELELTADPDLIQQVLINLVINAIHAVQEQPDPHIELTARMDSSSRVNIQVIDNGTGILEAVQEKIFIPFFTTKKQGSGIGLSLSRQVMRLHKGTISVHSKPNERTVFTLKF